jgi:hypothetical protein
MLVDLLLNILFPAIAEDETYHEKVRFMGSEGREARGEGGGAPGLTRRWGRGAAAAEPGVAVPGGWCCSGGQRVPAADPGAGTTGGSKVDHLVRDGRGICWWWLGDVGVWGVHACGGGGVCVRR